MTTSTGAAALIAGAGPPGLSAALILARHAIPVRIIDSNDGPTNLSKALVVWKRTMDTLNPVMPYARLADGHLHLRQAIIGFGGRRAAVVNFPQSDYGAPSSTERTRQCDPDRDSFVANSSFRRNRKPRVRGIVPGMSVAASGPLWRSEDEHEHE